MVRRVKETNTRRRVYRFAWIVPVILGIFITSSYIMPSTYGYFELKRESQVVSIQAASIEQFLYLLPGKAKAITPARGGESDQEQRLVANLSENNLLNLDFGELVPGCDTNFEEVILFRPVKEEQLLISWKAIGDIADLIEQSKTDIVIENNDKENQVLSSLNVKFRLDKDVKPQTYEGYLEIHVNGDFLSFTLPARVNIGKPSVEETVLYRVILDDRQVMALSQEDKAIDQVRKAIESGEAQTGKVQRTDDVDIFELPEIDITKATIENAYQSVEVKQKFFNPGKEELVSINGIKQLNI